MARTLQVFAICILAMLTVELAVAQCPSPLTFQDCLPYVGANGGQPDSKCCNLVKSSQLSNECLCNIAKANYPGVDFNKALLLPKECGRPVPKGTKCNNVEVPS